MAQHLAPQTKRHLKEPERREPLLPKVLRFKPQRKGSYERDFSLWELLIILAAGFFCALAALLRVSGGIKIGFYALASVLAGFRLIQRCVRCLLRGEWPNDEPLILVGVILAFCIGEYAAGSVALILYRLGELAQAYVLARSEAGLDAMRDLLPEKALVEREEKLEETVPESIVEGDLILVKPGQLIPLDGEVVEGVSAIDPSPLTGGTGVRSVGPGSEVASGCINVNAPLRIRVIRGFEGSAAASFSRSFEDAQARVTKVERLIKRGSTGYILGAAILALVIGVVVPIFTHQWVEQLRRAVIFLLLSSPSALVISVPLAYLGALLSAGRKGIMVKGKDVVEKLASAKTMIFGKTGTITEGKYTITDVFPYGVTEQELLAVAAAAESYSRHPIAVALKQAGGWTTEIAKRVLEVEEIPGKGVSAFIEGRHVYVGNAALMEDHGVMYKVPNRAGAAIHVAVENEYWGHAMVSDRIREGAFDALETLRNLGVNNLVMLTGDVLSVSRPIAASLNFDLVKAELSQQGKLSAIAYLRQGISGRNTIAYVGDGINDAPLFAQADIGIAVNALEKNGLLDAADVAVMDDDIMGVINAVKICSASNRIALEIVLLVLVLRLVLLLLAAVGALPILTASILDCVMTVLAALNALRSFILR